RVTGTKRVRDGYIDDKSGNQDPDNYGDENYALYLRWTPTDNFEINTRGNERSYRRRMGGADAAGIVNLTENGGVPDPAPGAARNTSSFAWGYRAVDVNAPCGSLIDRTVGNCAITAAQATAANQPGAATVYNYTDPVSGLPVTAQRVTPGVDAAYFATQNTRNQAFGT